MSQDISQLLECPICTESFNDSYWKPKVLPCQHTFCLNCSRNMTKEDQLNFHHHDHNKRKTLKCPNCNKMFYVPSGDADKFPNNLTVMSLLDLNSPARKTMSTEDLKKYLRERLQHLRGKSSDVQTDHKKVISGWDQMVQDTKESIHSEFFTAQKNLIQTLKEREAQLVAELNDFSVKRKKALEEVDKLADIPEFCNKTERGLERSSEKNVAENLHRCLEKLESVEKLGQEQNKTKDGDWSLEFKEIENETKRSLITTVATCGQLVLTTPDRADHGRKRKVLDLREAIARERKASKLLSPEVPELHTNHPSSFTSRYELFGCSSRYDSRRGEGERSPPYRSQRFNIFD